MIDGGTSFDPISCFALSSTETAGYLTETPASTQSMSPVFPLTPVASENSLVKQHDDIGLRAILFAEFNNVHGPMVAYQWPENFIPRTDSAKERLETTKDMGLYGTFLIPHEALSGHLCSWTHGRYTFLTCPVTYEDPKYFRNQYRTNLIFAFDSHAQIKPFHSVIRRVSQSFQMLERDFEWVSRQSKTATLTRGDAPTDTPSRSDKSGDKNGIGAPSELLGKSRPSVVSLEDALLQTPVPAAGAEDAAPAGGQQAAAGDDCGASMGPIADMPSISQVLKEVGEGLCNNNEAVIELGRGEILTYKYFPPIPCPPEVQPWDVPVQLHTPENTGEWDLALQMIIPRVDGRRTVAAIAHLLDMPVQACCYAVRHLVYYGFVRTIDVFQYSNIYTLIPRTFAHFCGQRVRDPNVLRYVSRDPTDPIAIVPLIQFYQVFGAHSQDSYAFALDVPGALDEFKRVETVVRLFGEQHGSSGGMWRGAERGERKLGKWRSEWRDEVQKKLSVRHAGMSTCAPPCTPCHLPLTSTCHSGLRRSERLPPQGA